MLEAPQGHQGVQLDADARERLLTWLDTYAQRIGSFSDAQEQELGKLRRASIGWLCERPLRQEAALPPAFGTAGKEAAVAIRHTLAGAGAQ